MAVTDPDARARTSARRCSSSPPTRRACASCATSRRWSTRSGSFGKLGNHAEILYEDVRVPAGEPARRRRARASSIAQQRLGPGRIHHCMRWLGVSRRAFDMLCERALSREAHGGPLADKQTSCRTGSPTRPRRCRPRGCMTLHAAWVMDTQGASAARTGDLADQVLRRAGAARRRRPRAAGPRRAGLLDRPAARGDVPLRARGALLRRPRRGPPPGGRAADPARLPGAARRRADRARPDAAARRRAGASPTCSRR